MSFNNTITLSTGASIPQIGLGTWLSKPKEVENSVEHAIRSGYRHLDLAMIYQNQDEVGAALKKCIPSVVNRSDLFITSKLWNSSHQPQEAEKELDRTLEQLGLDYLDLYLIHWPEGETALDTETSLVETWKAMIKLPKSKVKAIGVSNFRIAHIEAIIAATGVVPVVNQVEAHPLLPQEDLLAFCKSKGIHMTAYSPLGNNLVGRPNLTNHSKITSLAEAKNCTPAQILIAWSAQRGYSVIPKSIQPARIESNFVQVELSAAEMQLVGSLVDEGRVRFNIPYTYQPKWDISIFDEEIEKGATFGVKVV
ncbi:NADP-dependent oxidoreductase domain-containing protein [Infundibulicybe gibba]|nr:NADP-dependent oxidoreductase domain-containing protein [Infundibulicybe gibba]